MYKYDSDGKLTCNNCGSRTFKLVAELTISDVSSDGEDPLANRTIESENVISLLCARCGRPINND